MHCPSCDSALESRSANDIEIVECAEWRDLSTVLRMLSYRVLSNNPTVGRLLAEFQAKSQF
jgi:hypothetical protein